MYQNEDPIDAWWSAFESTADELDAQFCGQSDSEFDLPQWMWDHLHPVHPSLMWEYGPAVHKEGHRLVITCEVRRDLRPLVDAILKKAPQLDRWEFYGYRLPESYEVAVETVKSRTGGDISGTFCRATLDNMNRVDLEFLAGNYTADDEQAYRDVFVAAESLLGEEWLDRWIGGIDVGPLPEELGNDVFPIEELRTKVAERIDEAKSGLLDLPYHRFSPDGPEGVQWATYKLKPEEAEDYVQQTDLMVRAVMNIDIWRNIHSSAPFDSARFSKCDETFCYLKIDGTNGLDEEKFADRGDIQDAVDEALRAAQAGSILGGGTGLKYSYVDLALVDVPRGAEIIKDVLRAGNIPKRTWILFYDVDLQSRWISIWDDSPPPPMPEFEEE